MGEFVNNPWANHVHLKTPNIDDLVRIGQELAKCETRQREMRFQRHTQLMRELKGLPPCLIDLFIK